MLRRNAGVNAQSGPIGTTSRRRVMTEQHLELTERQLQNLELVVEGKTNQEIGVALGLSIRTVEEHLRRIYTRLNVPNRTAAATWWATQSSGATDPERDSIRRAEQSLDA